MSVTFIPQPAVASPFQEPPRPAPVAAQESARPVLAPEQSQAAAQETRRDEERRIQREQERKAEQRAAAERTGSPGRDAGETRPAPARSNLNVGSLVDDYA